jgi:predicted CXXCH cytochrome family protein
MGKVLCVLACMATGLVWIGVGWGRLAGRHAASGERENDLHSLAKSLIPGEKSRPVLFREPTRKPGSKAHSSASADLKGYVGMEACATCHADIYASYVKTAMAQASGPATENLIAGELEHSPSGVHYRVYAENGAAWLSFERPGDTVQGTRKLLYFIGSGLRGRTYLFAVGGFVFESPINWYAQRRVWDMAPGYQSTHQIPMTLPASASCLACHTSNMQTPEPGTENKYSLPLFAHSGITCERCHGPGAAHVSGKGESINPSKLAPSRRDSICMQCHLEGNVAIERPGKHLYEFRPGDNLTDYVRYYVFADDGSQSLRAVSQFEALTQSVCKRKSGDAMSCTSCHDPHFSPDPKEKASFYRNKCLACHGVSFGGKHHPNKPNCMECHMPAINSADVAHTQATDHRILRVPLMPLQSTATRISTKPRLVRFPPDSGKDDLRDLALAWTSQAEAGKETALTEAEELSRKALAEDPDDSALLSAAGYFAQRRQKIQEARDYYRHALRVDPYDNDAATNLGVIEAQAGDLKNAITLWKDAFERAPAKSAIGMNLARAYCASGQLDEARASVGRVLEFSPDLPEAKELMRNLSADPPGCARH